MLLASVQAMLSAKWSGAVAAAADSYHRQEMVRDQFFPSE